MPSYRDFFFPFSCQMQEFYHRGDILFKTPAWETNSITMFLEKKFFQNFPSWAVMYLIFIIIYIMYMTKLSERGAQACLLPIEQWEYWMWWGNPDTEPHQSISVCLKQGCKMQANVSCCASFKCCVYISTTCTYKWSVEIHSNTSLWTLFKIIINSL